MARIRSIKPEIRRSKALARVSLGARLTFVWLMTLADDAGRFEADPVLLRADLFPRDNTIDEECLTKWLAELVDIEKVRLYNFKGEQFGDLPGWHHQRIDKPQPSRIPSWEEREPDIIRDSVANDSEVSRESVGNDRRTDKGSGIRDQGSRTKDQGSGNLSTPPDDDVPPDFVAAFVESSRQRGSDPTPVDKGRLGKAAARLRKAGKPDELILAAVERAAERNQPGLVERYVGDIERERSGHRVTPIAALARKPLTVIERAKIGIAFDKQRMAEGPS